MTFKSLRVVVATSIIIVVLAPLLASRYKQYPDRDGYKRAPDGYRPIHTNALVRRVGLCEYSKRASWIALGSITNASYPSRKIPWTGGRPLEATDVTFRIEKNIVGEMPAGGLIEDRVSNSGETIAGRLLDSPNRTSERPALLFLFDLNGIPLAGRGTFFPSGGYYAFPNPENGDQFELVEESQIAQQILNYRNSETQCADQQTDYFTRPPTQSLTEEIPRIIGSTAEEDSL